MVNVLKEKEEEGAISSHFMLRNKRYQTCEGRERERKGAREEGREGLPSSPGTEI